MGRRSLAVLAVLGLMLGYAGFAAAQEATAGSGGGQAASPVSDEQQAAAGEEEVVYFANIGRVFPPLYAEPREPQIRVGFMYDFGGDTFYDMVFGGDLPLFRTKGPGERESSFTVRGVITPRFNLNSESFDLLNTDFIGGVAYGWRTGPTYYEASIFHESSHLGDEVLDFGERERRDVSHEAVRFLAGRKCGDVFVYGGPTFLFRADPEDRDDKFVIQAGGQYDFGPNKKAFYVALDVQSKQENDWEPNAALQLGARLGDPDKVRERHRLFVELFTGRSNMGQYYDETESYVMAGVAYTLR